MSVLGVVLAREHRGRFTGSHAFLAIAVLFAFGFAWRDSVTLGPMNGLLAADWALRVERPRDTWLFRGLAGLLVVLLFAIMASALRRMFLYQGEFGLTELRVYTMAFMGCLPSFLSGSSPPCSPGGASASPSALW